MYNIQSLSYDKLHYVDLTTNNKQMALNISQKIV